MAKLEVKMQVIVLLTLTLITGFMLLDQGSEANAAEKQLLSENVYTDPKGFFRMVPPKDWQLQEFKDDPRAA